MKDNHELAMERFATQQTWMEKTGGFARDMTLRDHFAGLAMTTLLNGKDACSMHNGGDTAVAILAYKMADAILKERAK